MLLEEPLLSLNLDRGAFDRLPGTTLSTHIHGIILLVSLSHEVSVSLSTNIHFTRVFDQASKYYDKVGNSILT
jgi:hypothetical protein